MQSMTNAQDFQFWMVGLCIAVTVAILTVTALWFMWKRQSAEEENPENLDPARQFRINERLAQLNHDSGADRADHMMRAS